MEVVLFVVLGGLIVGALGRLAVPGPDPMPIWMTILLGIVGSVLGALVAGALGLGSAGFILSVIGAALVLIAYRRFVQRRPITGPRARRR
ncbi:MAG TPA: GlsB/YeaQ/YmgE family stress response membrane protein [Gaiellaceae bacterium]|nr:GlsB/YeaQ/YmgE family stress response membrane protein [Gaiellaceae bacterium]